MSLDTDRTAVTPQVRQLPSPTVDLMQHSTRDVVMLDSSPLTMPGAPPLSRSLSKTTPRDPALRPYQTPKVQTVPRAEDDISVQPSSQMDDQSIWPSDETSTRIANNSTTQAKKAKLDDLPIEILELIVGNLVGRKGSVGASSRGSENGMRNWNDHMRHPRRKHVANLALVCRKLRPLIQERLFRHIKVQGTVRGQEDCLDFFHNHPHLQRHVRHLQILVPIWEMKRRKSNPAADAEIINNTRNLIFQTLAVDTSRNRFTTPQIETSSVFQLASQNATLEEILATAKILFQELCALTIEAGHCKRPPQIKFFRHSPQPGSLGSKTPVGFFDIGPEVVTSQTVSQFVKLPALPRLPTVNSLILKGAWNIIRCPVDYKILTDAIPNLQEFHCSYHAPKTDAYIAMCLNLRSSLSANITHLNIGLDGLYTKRTVSLQKWRKVFPTWHVCSELAAALPQLESLTYTGRVCHQIFSTTSPKSLAPGQEAPPVNSRLTSIDLIVNSICCNPFLSSANTLPIYDREFIEGFHALILSAVRALPRYTALNKVRIRYIDLDSPIPLMNPCFHLESGLAWGFWSHDVCNGLRFARPESRFLGLRNRQVESDAAGRGVAVPPKPREEGAKRSMSVDYYRELAGHFPRSVWTV